MEEHTLAYLLGLAATIGAVHTIMGPDHYVPFLAMARAGAWSLRKTIAVTVVCGVGHVLGSVLLGALGIGFGWALGGLDAFESARSSVAGWLLLGFGLAYTAWGVRRAIRNRPHSHLHVHGDGPAHIHSHTHAREHAHVHAAESGRSVMTAWALFAVFVFGPCEPLVPMLMYPAAEHSWWGICWVAAVFAAATVGAMTALVAAGYLGLAKIVLPGLERYSHAAAGLALTMCGLAIKLGF